MPMWCRCGFDHIWGEPDEGIWEVRGDRKHFSKMMAWVAFDRAHASVIKPCLRFVSYPVPSLGI
jgi:hypothetical protein